MPTFLLLLFLVFSPMALYGQNQPPAQGQDGTNGQTLRIRPNSRDYTIVRKGNNHQQLLQMRTQAMMKHKQAMMNRKMAMEKRRIYLQQRMMRQQQIHQRMIRQHHPKR